LEEKNHPRSQNECITGCISLADDHNDYVTKVTLLIGFKQLSSFSLTSWHARSSSIVSFLPPFSQMLIDLDEIWQRSVLVRNTPVRWEAPRRTKNDFVFSVIPKICHNSSYIQRSSTISESYTAKVCVLVVTSHQIQRTTKNLGFKIFILYIVSGVEKFAEFNVTIIFQSEQLWGQMSPENWNASQQQSPLVCH